MAQALNNLALLHWEYGRFDAAEPLYRRALAINEEAFGPQHPEVAFLLHNLGRLAWDRGDPAAALPLFQRALAIREQVLKPKHPELARALNSLGMVHRDLGDLGQAEALLNLRIRLPGLIPADCPEKDQVLDLLKQLESMVAPVGG